MAVDRDFPEHGASGLQPEWVKELASLLGLPIRADELDEITVRLQALLNELERLKAHERSPLDGGR